ncbi:hypothetical protein GCM10022262_19150 [Georgenia daeguensis]|uniref:Uncharacterized protein n=1 Tax=Georgenia daeguensis TaxID=908355 RepID=A0ABP8EUA3_9MICO
MSVTAPAVTPPGDPAKFHARVTMHLLSGSVPATLCPGHLLSGTGVTRPWTSAPGRET